MRVLQSFVVASRRDCVVHNILKYRDFFLILLNEKMNQRENSLQIVYIEEKVISKKMHSQLEDLA